MSWTPYFALILLPMFVILPFNIIAFSWGFRHGADPMPPELLSKSKQIDNLYGLWIRGGLLLLAVLALAIHHSIPFSLIGLRLNGWQWNLAIGVSLSVVQIFLQGLVWRLALPAKRLKGDQRLLEGSARQWI